VSHMNTWTEEQKKQYYELLEEMQQVDFVLVDLNHYLNTHPEDNTAIKQYNEFAQKSMVLKNKFQALFGPLYHFGNSYSTYPWSWKDAPWPWQV
jgi:spore coat protein JB